MTNFDIDEHIKARFQLFQGKRQIEEDQKIYDKVYALVLNEMILFVGQNVSKEDMDKLSNRLDSEDPKTVFLDTMSTIPRVKPRLEARLKYFVDQLVLDSIERHKSKK